MSDPYLIVSCDGHAGPPTDVYRRYLTRELHDAFDRRHSPARAPPMFTEIHQKGLVLQAHKRRWKDPDQESLRERLKAAWIPTLRLQEMDREGIVAEVIFPDGQFDNDFPFGGFFGFDEPDKRFAGACAHNRWIAEYCSSAPQRLLGLGLIMPFEITAAVREVERCHREGLRGILLSTNEPSLPFYYDRRYDPLWAACVERGLPVHVHGGQTPHVYGESYPAAQIATEFEANFYRRRGLAHFLLGGVFLRHPTLQLVCAETGIDWIPAELRRMDRAAETESMILGLRPKDWLRSTPSELWHRNCFAGATFVSKEELAVWVSLGSDRIMWGSDFPHVETTWPHSQQSISRAFAGLTNEDARRMLGLNAVHLYKLDMECLVAKAVEISDESFAIPVEAPMDSSYTDADYAESRVFAESTFARQLRKTLST